jgi:hypothetical protein
VFPGLIYKRACEQFDWVELADRKSVEPGLMSAGAAPDPQAVHVPLSGFHAVRPALTERKTATKRECRSVGEEKANLRYDGPGGRP